MASITSPRVREKVPQGHQDGEIQFFTTQTLGSLRALRMIGPGLAFYIAEIVLTLVEL